MTRSRERRPQPEPRTLEEEAEIEAKYRLLFRRLKRYHARMDERERADASHPPGSCQAERD